MLQTVQKYQPTGKVSSLYCVWTTRDGGPNSPLIAIWMDASMQGFEGEIAPAAESDCAELRADEPGSYLLENAAAKPETFKGSETFQR